MKICYVKTRRKSIIIGGFELEWFFEKLFLFETGFHLHLWSNTFSKKAEKGCFCMNKFNLYLMFEKSRH